jgi:glucose-6-phosphate 1-epimerase
MGDLQWIHVAGPLAEGVVCEQGAQVCDWTPTEEAPVLFLSGASRMEPGQPIRGGIPVVFPWFGEDPERRGRPAHGFARRMPWRPLGTEEGPDGVRVGLELVDDEASLALWPHRFALRLHALFGAAFELRLEVENRGAAPFRCETALHTYLEVGDVRSVAIHGLGGAEYLDQLDGLRRVQEAGILRIDGETDRIYHGHEARVLVEDPEFRRTISIEKTGSRSTVVWNPWVEKTARLDDLDDEEWPMMLCVESGNIGEDALTLGPGEVHAMVVRLGLDRA